MRSWVNLIIRIAAAFFSGILLYAAFPSVNLSFLAWFALVPLLIVCIRARPLHCFFLSFFFGVVFYTGVFYWIFSLQKYNILHHAILGVYLCPLTGGFGLAVCYIAKRQGVVTALSTAPFFWVIQEYIRSNLSFLSLPWGLLAHSQYQHPMIIQIADISGTYGLSFLIVLVNSAIAALLYAGFARLISSRRTVSNPFLKQARLPLITAILCMLVLFYGYVQTSRPVEGQALKISVIQGNIEQSKKWDKKYAPVIMQIYADLTQTASLQTPDLIVWPETATPGAINQDPRLYERVRKIAGEANTPLLLGSAQVQKLKVERSQVKGIKYLNSAYLVFPNRDKTKDQRYDKIRLLPFGEYLPYKKAIPWSYINIPEIDYFMSGKTFTLFKLDAHQFGVTICWENIFPDIVRQFVKEGAGFIINLTNEAWFGESAAPYQFLSMSVFRAVENKIYIIRCANTGISCFIDPQGRIVDRVKDSSGHDIFVRGILTATVIPHNHKTLYVQYGDWFVWANLIGMLLTLLASFFKKSNGTYSQSSIR